MTAGLRPDPLEGSDEGRKGEGRERNGKGNGEDEKSKREPGEREEMWASPFRKSWIRSCILNLTLFSTHITLNRSTNVMH